MPRRSFEIFGGLEYQIPRFSAGAVARIVGLDDVWKLQKLLDSPRYRLRASGQLGEGKGSRRWFTITDVYRIGIAAFLAKDGFAPKMIAKVLEEIEDHHLIDFNDQGEVYTGIKLVRTGSGPRLDFYRATRPPEIKLGGDVYYALDLSEVTAGIDRQIFAMTAKKREGKRGSF